MSVHLHTSFLTGSSSCVCVSECRLVCVVNDQRSCGEDWGQGWVRLVSSFKRISVISLGSDKPLLKECKAEILGDALVPYLISKAGKG